MPDQNPASEEYLAVVSEWESYGLSGGRVGNVYPIYSLSTNAVVDNPLELFPNPGYVFLVNRGELSAWDFVCVRPQANPRYKNESTREAFYISHPTPVLFDQLPESRHVAMLLNVTRFDHTSDAIEDAPQNVTPLFFVRDAQGTIFGPLFRTSKPVTKFAGAGAIKWRPQRNDGFVYKFTLSELTQQGIQVLTYEHPQPDLSDVVRMAFTLFVGDVAAVTSDQFLDLLPDAQLAEWYCKYKELPPNTFTALCDAIRSNVENATDAPELALRGRLNRLRKAIRTLEFFEAHRRDIVRQYFESEPGKAKLEEQLRREIERRSETIDTKVIQLRDGIAQEQKRLESDLALLQTSHDTAKAQLESELNTLRNDKVQLLESIDALQHQMRSDISEFANSIRENVPLIVALSAGLHARPGVANDPQAFQEHGEPSRGWAAVAPCAPTRPLVDWAGETDLVDMLTHELRKSNLHFTHDFVTNIFICLKCNSLNLIAGPPGHGKSSIVRELARALGHHDSFLDITVRRSWSDDRYLLGFYDTFHGTYEPGQTGLATKLLQAQVDWDMEANGIYVILLDEFNLAAPEYYFTQLMQKLPLGDAVRTIRLFDPIGKRTEQRAPDEIQLHRNVSVWGTINHDETTERLSPRLLDRTGTIFLSSRDVAPSVLDGDGQRTERRGAVKATQLFNQFRKPPDDCPAEAWKIIEPLLVLLKKESPEWGLGIELSPRLVTEMRRYLANSIGLLDPVVGADFGFQQRILPILHGRGNGFNERVKALAKLLEDSGLGRSASHVQSALGHAELNFDAIDFFAY